MIGDVVVKIAADTSQYERGLGKARREMSSFKQAVGSASSVLASGFGAATIAVTGGISYAVKEASKFQTAFTGLRKTTDATAAEFKKLERGILDMSREVPASAAEIADVAAAAGRLGIKTKDILKFTRTMVDMGEATNMTSEQAADAFARFGNIMNMPTKNVDRLASTVVHLGNNFATSESEIMNMALRLASAGKTAGWAESDVISLAAAMSSLGVRAESGGTSMSKVLLDMNDAVMDGGKQLGRYAKVAGMTGKQFQKAFKDDAAGALELFVNGLTQTQKDGGNVNKVLKDMGFNGRYVKDSLLRLSNSQGILTKALSLGSDAWEKNTALQDEVAIRYADFSNILKILRNRLMSVVLIFGKPLMTVLSKMLLALDPVISIIEKLADKFDSLSDKTKETVAAVVLVIPAFLGLLTVVFSVIAAYALLDLTLGIVGLSIMGVIATITIFVAAAAAVAAAVKYVIDNWKKLGEKANELYHVLRTAFYDIKYAITSPIMTTSEKVDEVLRIIRETFGTFAKEIGKVAVGIRDSLIGLIPEPVIKAVESGVDKIRSGFDKLEEAGISLKNVVGLMTGPLATLAIVIAGLSGPVGIFAAAMVFLATKTDIVSDAIKMFKGEMTFEEVMKNVGDMILKFVDDFQKLIDIVLPIAEEFIKYLSLAFIEGIPVIVETVITIVDKILQTFIEILPSIIEAGVGIISALIEGIIEMTPILIETFMILLQKISELVIESIPLILEAFTELLVGIMEAVVESTPLLIESFTSLLETIVDTIIEFIPMIIETAIELITAFVEGFTEALPKIIDAAILLLDTLVDAIIELLPVVIDAGFAILDALIDGLVESLPTLIDTAADLIIKLVDAIVELLPKVIDAGIQIVLKLIDGIISQIPNLIGKIGMLLGKLVVRIIQHLPQLLMAGVKLIGSLIKGILSLLAELLAAGATLISGLLGKIFSFVGQMLSKGKELISSLISGALSMLGSLLGAGGELISSLVTKIGSFVGQMLSKGKELIGSVVNGIKSKVSAVGNAAKDVGNRIKSTLTNFKGKMKSVGSNLIKGVTEGIKSMKDGAIKAAKSVGSGIKNTLTKFFSIKSPSRVMKKEVGVQIVAGLINGMRNQINPLVRMSKKVAEAAKPDLPELDSFDVGDVRGHAKKVTSRLSVADERERNRNEKGGFNQTVNIHSNRPLSPSEMARKQKQASQRWALEMGF